jgi:hypothetical protein
MLRGLTLSKTATFEYQVSDTASVALAVDIHQFIPMLGELQKAEGFDVESDKKDAATFRVELRTNPHQASGTATADVWGKPLNCGDAPAAKVVKVSYDLEIQDDKSFEEWLSSSSRCAAESVFWILDAPPKMDKAALMNRVRKYAVAEKVKDKGKVVIAENSDVTGSVPLAVPNQ